PVGLFVCDYWVVHRRLHIAGDVGSARGDAVLAWRSRPVEMPKAPREGRLAMVFKRGFHPGTVVDFHFHGGNRTRPPGHPSYAVMAIAPGHSRRGGFQQPATDGRFHHDHLAIALFL